MENLASFGWWKLGLILGLFALLFVFRALSPIKPGSIGRPRRRRRR
jgi:hypothetical protein